MDSSNRVHALRTIIIPVTDIDAAVTLYSEAFGWTIDFRDEDRWVQLDAGTVKVALAGPGGGYGSNHIGLSIKVQNVSEEVNRVVEAGAVLVQEPEDGRHEKRAAFNDTNGHPFHLYSPQPE